MKKFVFLTGLGSVTIVMITACCLVFCSALYSAEESCMDADHEDHCAACENGCCHTDACTNFYSARLCSNCGFGSKKDNCVLCGKWIGSGGCPARLCSNCGFGSKKDNCVICGKWIGSGGCQARLCSNCGFGSKKTNCVKCGKWAP